MPSQFFQVNQTYSTPVTIVNQTFTLVGRIVAPFGRSATNPIADVPVTISAVTHYDGSTPVVEQARAVTNAQGCFALTKAPGAHLDLTATTTGYADCGTLHADTDPGITNIAELGSTQATVKVQTDDTVQAVALGTTGTTLAALPAPTPGGGTPTGLHRDLGRAAPRLAQRQQRSSSRSSTRPVTRSRPAGSTGLSFAGANLTVTKGVGDWLPGTVGTNAGVTGDGHLTWSDSKAGASNIWPGRYNYTLTVPGYEGGGRPLGFAQAPAGAARLWLYRRSVGRAGSARVARSAMPN